MAFTVLFIAHSPDADKEKHRSVIDTGMYQFHSVVVKDQSEAVEIAIEYTADHPIDSILLCPGFTHLDVAEISKSVGENIAVGICRSDGPGYRISMNARKRVGYPNKSK